MSSLTETDPRDTRVKQSARHHAAVRYIEQHAAMHLHEEGLIHACAVTLVADHGVADGLTAHAIAMEALAEVQARSLPAWIDISLSTSRACRVVNPVTGQVATFTASELIQIAQERAQANAGTSTEPEPARDTRCLN